MGNQVCLQENHVTAELTDGEFRFKFRIEGFTSLSEITAPDLWPFSSQFGTKTNIGLPSAWRMTLSLADTDQVNSETMVNLTLKQTRGLPDLKDFSLNVSVKQWYDPNEDLIAAEVTTKEPTQPFGSLAQIMEASVRGSLYIHGRFELHFPTDPTAAIVDWSWGCDVGEMFDELRKNQDQFLNFVIKVKELGPGGDGDYVEVKVHQFILEAGSNILQKKVDDEANSGSVTIDDLTPACVNIMVHFMYTGNLEDGWKDVAAELVRAGDKYGLGLPLRDFLDRNLQLAMNLGNAWKLREVTKTHELDIASKAINNFIITNIEKF